MAELQQFGGDWTKDKLDRLDGYLKAYMTILKNYPYLQTVYVDAFAGTGERKPSSYKRSYPSQFVSVPLEVFADDVPNELSSEELEETRLSAVLKGSVRVALEVNPPFGKYIFVERSAKKCRQLEKVKEEYPALAERITIQKSDANAYLTEWIAKTDWKKTRAVVFLDPFGMQVKWTLLEQIAQTRGIDLWLLVPIGMGANRLMTQGKLPNAEWTQKLTEFFGTDEWQTEHYRRGTRLSLFGELDSVQKDTDHDKLARYFVERLKTIFPGVASNPLTQRNSRNSPMFLLCFASANPKGAKTAIKIAQDILKR